MDILYYSMHNGVQKISVWSSTRQVYECQLAFTFDWFWCIRESALNAFLFTLLLTLSYSEMIFIVLKGDTTHMLKLHLISKSS